MKSGVLKTLHDDHVNISRLLDLLESEIERLDADGTAPDFELITLALEYCVDYPGHYHHPREDLVYDRLVRRDPMLAGKITELTRDHTTLSEKTNTFATAVGGAIAGDGTTAARTLGRSFLARYRRHIDIEEGEIFPAAHEHLTQEDWEKIEVAASSPPDPLFGDHVRDAYRALHRRIMKRAENNTNKNG